MSKGIIHPIELYVSNLKKSVEFWGWFLEEMGIPVSKMGNRTKLEVGRNIYRLCSS